MPIEIKELLIKVTVQETNQNTEASTGSGGGPKKEAMVQECVEKVMELLHAKNYDR